MPLQIRVLQIEDSKRDAELIVHLLQKDGFTVNSLRVQDAQGVRDALARMAWDIVICDHDMPQFDAPAALEILRETGLDIPFIVVSGAIGEEIAVRMMKSGAHDYLTKNNLARLGAAVTRELRDADSRRERRRAEEALRETVDRLQSALDEKTVLLKEVHHRVKNNLAVVSSLLALKADATRDRKARLALEESQQRVQSIALVHEHLYGTDNLGRINFAEYARELVQAVRSTFTAGDRFIGLDFALEPIELSIEQAVPCALILNELLSNAFKYAFADGNAGRIRISFRQPEAGHCELAVEDDGVGLPPGRLAGQNKSLGLRIVRILANQLNGSLEQKERPGTRIVLRFPAAASAAEFAPITHARSVNCPIDAGRPLLKTSTHSAKHS
jgi:two-component sensor histidine kinase/methylmalonyl-CoA mutase cobalamin-binding subunit